jgi:hypothetical protein
MGDGGLRSVLAATGDDQGLVSILITVMIAAVWVIASLAKGRGGSRPQGKGQEVTPGEVFAGPPQVPDRCQAPMSLPSAPHGPAHGARAWEPEIDSEPLSSEIPEAWPYPWHDSVAGLWPPLGGPDGESLLADLDPDDRLGQVIVIDEILAPPLSMRPMD